MDTSETTKTLSSLIFLASCCPLPPLDILHTWTQSTISAMAQHNQSTGFHAMLYSMVAISYM